MRNSYQEVRNACRCDETKKLLLPIGFERKQSKLAVFQKAMRDAGHLPPGHLNGEALDEPTLAERVQNRKYAQDGGPGILMPTGFGR